LVPSFYGPIYKRIFANYKGIFVYISMFWREGDKGTEGIKERKKKGEG
jgi:drug/metabolite transporter superfamily protein YnfA